MSHKYVDTTLYSSSAGHDDGSVRVWNLESSTCIDLQHHSNTVTCLAMAQVSEVDELLFSAGDLSLHCVPSSRGGMLLLSRNYVLLPLSLHACICCRKYTLAAASYKSASSQLLMQHLAQCFSIVVKWSYSLINLFWQCTDFTA